MSTQELRHVLNSARYGAYPRSPRGLRKLFRDLARSALPLLLLVGLGAVVLDIRTAATHPMQVACVRQHCR